MLFHDSGRTRWFLVPDDVELPDGDFAVRSFSRVDREVDEAAIAMHEVDVGTARAWIDERFKESFSRAGEAFGRLASRVREAARGQGRDIPDLSGMRVSPEELLGLSPGELYADPSKGREAVEKLFSWASERLRPEGERPAERPPLEDALKTIGASLKAAASRLEQAAAEARRRRQEQRDRRAKKAKLRRVGFFRDLPHGDPDQPSLAEVRREASQPHEADIARYLEEAPVLIASPGPVTDVLDPDAGHVGTRSIHTDGTWCWPGDLAHYVRRYHVVLPSEFREHLIQGGWQVGDVDTEELEF